MAQAWKLRPHRVCQQEFDPVAVHDVGRMDGDAEDASFGVHQHMAFASFDLLAAIIPAHPTDAGGLDRLAVNDPSAGLGITPQADAEPLAQDGMEALPRPIQPPHARIVIDRLPGRPFLRQEAPGAARAQDGEDGVQNRPPRVDLRTTGARRRGEEWSDELPLGSGQIASVERGAG